MGNTNWGRMRDTKSVEPNLLPNRNYNAEREKIHSKPPSGRRHSTIGMERVKMPNLELLPPRLRKRYFISCKFCFLKVFYLIFCLRFEYFGCTILYLSIDISILL